ncbi:uncharacterized protein LOC108044805, partial [Drosophila rhopaloa]|uniref:Uncharacterized protein n=1 Tax=Drosophila rhopaloa TaxID=1041015 RepID=A0ABM5HF31_DRORH
VCFPQPIVFQKGNTKYILESLEMNCDHDYVTFFHNVANSKVLHTFRVVKLVSAFTIDIKMKVLKTQRILYKLENINGCEFLSNPVRLGVIGENYKHLVVNGSFFKCPIKPNIYYLKSENILSLIPNIHPPGRFQLSLRVKVAESSQPFNLEMLLKYNIIRIK